MGPQVLSDLQSFAKATMSGSYHMALRKTVPFLNRDSGSQKGGNYMGFGQGGE
jgi:hypothetical protein